MLSVAGEEPSRWDVEDAIQASSLPSPSRLLLYTLLTKVTKGTLTVPAEFAPSLNKLAKQTGLSKSTVAEHLNLLEDEKWLERDRPTTREAMQERARTAYQIRKPVRDADLSGSRTSPGAGQVDEESQVGTCPGAGPVQEPDRTSPGAGHNQKSFPKSSSSTKKKTGGAGGNKPRAKGDEEHPRFAEWYEAYPNHKAIGAARKAYNNAVDKGVDPDVLLAAAKQYAAVKAGTDARFIKHPSTWLNQECWKDEDLPATGTNGIPGHGPRARVNDNDWSKGGPRV